MGGLEHRGEDFRGRVEGVRCTWPVVQSAGDGIEFGLGVDGHTGALGQVLAEAEAGGRS